MNLSEESREYRKTLEERNKFKSGDKVILHKIDCNILLEEGYKVGDVVTLTHIDPYEGWQGVFPDGKEWSLVDCIFHRQESITDNVNSPTHYNHSGLECIDALAASLGEEGFKAYCRGNVIKYLWRLEHKGKSIEDAKKARWYLNKLIERMEENG